MMRLSGWIGVAALVGAPALAQDAPATEYYPLKVGSKWTFRIPGSEDKFVMTAAAVDKVGTQQCIKLEARVQGTIVATEHVAVCHDGVYRFKMNDNIIDPPICFCRIPPKKGDAWKADFKVGKDQAAVKFQLDMDDIAVPAGKFHALVVKGEVKERGNTIQTTYWFAPQVGVVKQLLDFGGNQVDLELEKFEPGR